MRRIWNKPLSLLGLEYCLPMAAGDEETLPRCFHNVEQNGEEGRGHSAPFQPVASGGNSFVCQVPGPSRLAGLLQGWVDLRSQQWEDRRHDLCHQAEDPAKLR